MNSQQDISFNVRNWVHYDTLATNMYRQTTNARKVRDEFEDKIIKSLCAANMEKAVIQIGDGRLTVHEERRNNPLTLTTMKDLLQSYYISKGLPDDSVDIIKYIHKQRGFEIIKRIKKHSGAILPPLPPLPSSQLSPLHQQVSPLHQPQITSQQQLT